MQCPRSCSRSFPWLHLEPHQASWCLIPLSQAGAPLFFLSPSIDFGSCEDSAGVGTGPDHAAWERGWLNGIEMAVTLGRRWCWLKFEPLGWCLWMVSALSRVSHRLLSGLFLTLPLVGPPLARYKGQYLDQGYALGSLPRDGDGQVSAKVTVIAWPLFLGCKRKTLAFCIFSFHLIFILPQYQNQNLTHSLSRTGEK